MKNSKVRLPGSKIFTFKEALLWRASLRRSGSRLVFTNGCFDLLHLGHVTYLNAARSCGDRLIVALNSDASVKKLKGADRPLVKLRDRMHVIAGLECVDAVIGFGAATPIREILGLRPDILVKGGDWEVDAIVGGREVKSWGGKVYSLPFVAGRSTTKIIEKAKDVKKELR